MVFKKKELFVDNTTNDETSTNTVSEKLTNYLSKGSLFLFFFLLLTINLVALSISLQCNVDGNIFYKIASGMFAFMFGILYIIFNYYMYRIKVNNKPCVICRTNIFELSF